MTADSPTITASPAPRVSTQCGSHTGTLPTAARSPLMVQLPCARAGSWRSDTGAGRTPPCSPASSGVFQFVFYSPPHPPTHPSIPSHFALQPFSIFLWCPYLYSSQPTRRFTSTRSVPDRHARSLTKIPLLPHLISPSLYYLPLHLPSRSTAQPQPVH